MSVAVQTESTLKLSSPTVLFEDRSPAFDNIVQSNYDVHPNGDLFVLAKPAASSPVEMTIVLNWFEELMSIER